MSLPECSEHERLFVWQQDAWIAFPGEIMTHIRAIYTLLCVANADFSDFEVFEVPCDRCEEEFEDLDLGPSWVIASLFLMKIGL